MELARESVTAGELPRGFYSLQYIRKQEKPAELYCICRYVCRLGLVYVIKETCHNITFPVAKNPKHIIEKYVDLQDICSCYLRNAGPDKL